MNYLAHALLSGPNEELRLGNFLGDFVKGRVENYRGPYATERLREGIRLHRQIDSFTDQHPVFRRSKARLSGRYGLRSGVIVDLTYDHFLANAWSEYSNVSLNEFSVRFLFSLKINEYRLEPPVRSLLAAMIHGNWLVGYAQMEGLERALAGMAQRFPVAAGIETSGEVIRAHYDEFGRDFQEFFPSILEFCRVYW